MRARDFVLLFILFIPISTIVFAEGSQNNAISSAIRSGNGNFGLEVEKPSVIQDAFERNIIDEWFLDRTLPEFRKYDVSLARDPKFVPNFTRLIQIPENN